MKLLLLCDDRYHPGDIPTKGVAPLQEKGYSIDIIHDANDFTAESLSSYDVVIMSKCDHVTLQDNSSWKTDAIQAAFVQYVENGGGLLVTHSGLVAGESDNTGVLDMLIGSRFFYHPNNSQVTAKPLKPHPITTGVGMFTEEDEHYRLEILADDIDILAASYSPPQGDPAKYVAEPYMNDPGCIAPAAYVRTQGKGRVCVLTPGHTHDVWGNSDFQVLLENAVRWCGRV